LKRTGLSPAKCDLYVGAWTAMLQPSAQRIQQNAEKVGLVMAPARRAARSLARACTTGRIWRGDIVNTPGRTAVDPVTVKLLLYSAQAGSRVGIRLACAPGAGPRRSRRAREGRTKRSAAIPRAPCHSSQ
jgi:hypothetical protein